MNKIIGLKRCPARHILGQMRRNGDGGELLELFRQAIDYGEDMPEPVDVIAVVTAGRSIRCSICGAAVDFYESPRFARHAAFE